VSGLRLVPQVDGIGLVSTGDIIKRALALYSSGGLPRGSSTGWEGLDRHYTVSPGQWTVVTGMPGCGKSEWLDALMVNLAEAEDWDFCLYSPENYPQETHLVKLVEKRLRKPFGAGPTERMTRQEFIDAAMWVADHFFWVDPTFKTPDELIATGLGYRQKGKQFGIVLDPWNTLDHSRGQMNETDYVSFILTQVTQLCRASSAHVWLVVHPAKIPRNKDGTRPVPTPYDISGSAHWYNKADNIVTVHRDQADDRSQRVEIHVQKVRFKHVGRVGMVELCYDRVTGTYFEAPWVKDHITGAAEQYADPRRAP